MQRPYKTYKGGKNGSGVYQAIINQIPPHEIFISGFAGNCGVMANKKTAAIANIVTDTDAAVVNDWKKISGITAINEDAISFINCFLSESIEQNIFIFLDPPYLMEVRSCKKNIYKKEMGDPATHLKLLQACRKIKHPVLITHYPCSLYDNELKDWRKLDIQGRTRHGMRTERLYMNYPQPEELHDYSFIGQNYRQREMYKRSKVNMIKKFLKMPPIERNFIISELKSNKII